MASSHIRPRSQAIARWYHQYLSTVIRRRAGAGSRPAEEPPVPPKRDACSRRARQSASMTPSQPLHRMAVRAELWPSHETPAHRYELRFSRLSNPCHGLAFPCDPKGRVDLLRLSEEARANYIRARSTVGSEFSTPVIHRRQHCGDTVIIDFRE